MCCGITTDFHCIAACQWIVHRAQSERLLSLTSVCGANGCCYALWIGSDEAAICVAMDTVGNGSLGKKTPVSDSTIDFASGMQNLHTLWAFIVGPV